MQLSQHGRKDFFEQSSCSSGGQEVPIVCADAAKLTAHLPIQSPQGCRTTLPRGGPLRCVLLICQCPEASPLQSPAFASVTAADSLFTAHVKAFLAPGCTLTTKFSVRRAQDTNSLSVFFSGGASPWPLVSTKVGVARAGFVAATTTAPTVSQGIVANLSRLERGLAVELASVASAATPDVSADSDSSTQASCATSVLDPSSRSLSSKVTAVPSDPSLGLTS